MTLDCRLVGSNAKLLTLTICRWLCYSVNVWHGECDEPDGGKRGILLWRMIVYWCYRFPVVIDQACVWPNCKARSDGREGRGPSWLVANEAFSLKSASVRWAGWATVTYGRVGKLKTRVGKWKIFFGASRRILPTLAWNPAGALFFKVTAFLKSNIITDKVTIAHRKKPYLTYGMVPCSVTLTDL